MKKIFLALTLNMIMSFGLFAQYAMWIYNSDGTIATRNISDIDSLNFSQNMIEMMLHHNGSCNAFSVDNIDSITFKSVQETESSAIYVDFIDDAASVRHNITSEDFVVTIDGADVKIVTNAALDNLQYYLSGYTANGSFSLESDMPYDIILNNVEINSRSTVPLNLPKNVERNIIIANGSTNTLSDSSDGNGKAVINTKGATNISGLGTLTVNANKKHGISSDNDINVNDVTLFINNTADASKGLKSDSNIILNDADVTIVSSGTLTLEELDLGYDPTYCTAIGADGNFEMSGGRLNITLPESNVAGRGIKTDGNISIFDGKINIVSHSGGNTYTNSEGNIDSYKSSCIKADGDIYLLEGEITLEATGDAGKCANADGKIYIGRENQVNDNLIINLKTTGKKFYESGSGENADYANPKALTAEGDLYVYGGNINIYTENDGGEGLESKQTVYIKGGYIIIDTYDDAINGKSHVQIDGGTLYANSRGNDAIDSNGTLTVNGGFALAFGQTAPEGAFDCDQNTFKITGGTLIGIGGHTSNPTASVCTQNSLVYSGGGPGGGPGGGNSSGLTLLFSSPQLEKGTVTIKQGGSISGGENFYGYYTDANYSGETSSKNVTIN